MPFRTALVALLLFASVLPAFAKAERPQAPPAVAVEGSAPAPDFTLRDLNGDVVTLSQFRGKVVFLNFWASWCPPCRAEMPSMERLNEVFADREFVMLAVNVEQGRRPVEAFLEQHSHSFPVLLDPDAKAQGLYQVSRYPETFLIDTQGRVVEHFIGARDWSSVDFLKQIDALLPGRP